MRDGLATPTDRAGVCVHSALPESRPDHPWGELRRGQGSDRPSGEMVHEDGFEAREAKQ
jgi:hypothetical protein